MPTWKKTQKKAYSKRNRLTRKKGVRKCSYNKCEGKDLKKVVTVSPEINNVETKDGLPARGFSIQTSGIPSPPEIQSSPAAKSDPLHATIPLDQLVSKVRNHLREIKNARRRKRPAITFDGSNRTITSDVSNLTNIADGSSNLTNISDDSSNLIDLSDDSSNLIDLSDDSSNLIDISDDSSNLIDISDDSSNLKHISDYSSNLKHISNGSSNRIETSEEETEESVYFLVSDAFD